MPWYYFKKDVCCENKIIIYLTKDFILIDENLCIYNLSEVKHYSNLKKKSREIL